MILKTITSYPADRRYVLKLHRESVPGARIRGRMENMATGRHFLFNSAEELLARLTEDMAAGGFSTQEVKP